MLDLMALFYVITKLDIRSKITLVVGVGLWLVLSVLVFNPAIVNPVFQFVLCFIFFYGVQLFLFKKLLQKSNEK